MQNFYDYITPSIWPLSSPNLNLLDYYVEQNVSRGEKSLKVSIIKVMFNMNEDDLIQACKRFMLCKEAIIKDERGFIE